MRKLQGNKYKAGITMRTFGAVLLSLPIFCVVFLILGIGCNFISAKLISVFGVYLSMFPAPIAAYGATVIARNVIQQEQVSKIQRAAIVTPLVVLSFAGGMLPELERLVLNAAADGWPVSVGESWSLSFVSWLLSFVSIRHAIKSKARRRSRGKGKTAL